MNSVGAQKLIVGQDATITTQGGDDTVALIASEFGGAVKIDAGSGRDLVLLHRIEISGVLDVDCGRGDDALAIAASRFADQASFDDGRGWDRLGLGVGTASNEFEFAPSPDSLSFEGLDSALVDEAIASVVERFGGFLQGAINHG